MVDCVVLMWSDQLGTVMELPVFAKVNGNAQVPVFNFTGNIIAQEI